MKVLIIINDAPYGTEKAYNALRVAMALKKEKADINIRVFLLADAVSCALPGQKTPSGYYNIERMLKSVVQKGGEIRACGGCSETRGISTLEFIQGVQLSNMQEFAQWTIDSDKVITF
jgi:uncharacterized protein involved in oxidation of intracellular sulfur